MRADCAEEPFENALLKLAVTHGWLVHASRKAHRKHHDGDENDYRTPIKGHRGFPDVVLSHPDHGLIVAELKAAKGRLGPGQPEWINSLVPLDHPGSKVLIELWRPADWPWIEIALRDGLDAYRTRTRRPPVTPGATVNGSDNSGGTMPDQITHPDFTVVLTHHATGKPGDVRHHPNGCTGAAHRNGRREAFYSEMRRLPACQRCLDRPATVTP